MRNYGKIFSHFWFSESIRGLSDQAKVLAVYLLSCKHGNSSGRFKIPSIRISADLNWNLDSVESTFNELESIGLLTRCSKTGLVVIHDYKEVI